MDAHARSPARPLAAAGARAAPLARGERGLTFFEAMFAAAIVAFAAVFLVRTLHHGVKRVRLAEEAIQATALVEELEDRLRHVPFEELVALGPYDERLDDQEPQLSFQPPLDATGAPMTELGSWKVTVRLDYVEEDTPGALPGAAHDVLRLTAKVYEKRRELLTISWTRYRFLGPQI